MLKKLRNNRAWRQTRTTLIYLLEIVTALVLLTWLVGGIYVAAALTLAQGATVLIPLALIMIALYRANRSAWLYEQWYREEADERDALAAELEIDAEADK